MIAFGSSITSPEVYGRCAKPGIELVAEPDSPVFAFQAVGSIFRSYNLILERAATLEDLEALVIVHQHAEIVDPDFCQKLRRALRDPEVGVVGCVGDVGVRTVAWWDGAETRDASVHRHGEAGPDELGAGEFPALSYRGDELPAHARGGEVETIDGLVMGLPPWTVRNIRFDEGLGRVHGYDYDFCLQVHAEGRKVVTDNFLVVHHPAPGLAHTLETWVEAHMRVSEKWEGRAPQVGAAGMDWKQRARRAEAEAAALRLLVSSRQLQSYARAQEAQLQIQAVARSPSWRVTAPLRRLNVLRAAGRGHTRPDRGRPAA